MGLTKSSTGISAIDSALEIKTTKNEKVIALAGNPNVGKSTLFNSLTGMNQHTGNWPGKTVANAKGGCKSENNSFILVDIPGTYSLSAHSAEEEVARDFICFGNCDAVIVVCDATCLERNMNLVLQTIEISKNVLVCVNLLDEAKRKKIEIDLPLLSKRLGVSVVGTVARNKKSLSSLLTTLDDALIKESTPYKITYSNEIEKAISIIESAIHKRNETKIPNRWLSLRLLENDPTLYVKLKSILGETFFDTELENAVISAKEMLYESGIDGEKLKDLIVKSIVNSAEEICDGVVKKKQKSHADFDRKTDKILTSKWLGFPTMLLLLCFIFFLTITGANYPSNLLSAFFEKIGNYISNLLIEINTPERLRSLLIDGMYNVLSWVVAVMLPPMAIFFPLFTLLEDVGYLPRIAYNLDCPFKKCRACGKQALTMCMGFGCNAAGVVGCRIIDSPRERLLAILTNNLVPCNGRFPALIAIITMFFVGFSSDFGSSALSTVLLTAVIVLGVLMTLLVTRLLSSTVLKGVPSSFTLELPPYRRPQIGKIAIRSIFDRTLFVLGRAAIVAAPAGIFLWVMSNVYYDGSSLLTICANFLDPFAKLLGLDGTILIAFILGLPANEIIVPIIIMAYTNQGSISEIGDLTQLKSILEANGWTWVTAVCVMVFMLLHWPCSTTLLTIKKETGSLKWTALAAVLPTALGIIICMAINLLSKLFI